MTMPQVAELFEYWDSNPPEHELIRILVDVYTTWTPTKKMTEEEVTIAHRKSLEQRWKGGAVNVKQLFEATGGELRSYSDHPFSVANIKPQGHPDIPGLNLAFPGVAAGFKDVQ
jgi:hypothetical protein